MEKIWDVTALGELLVDFTPLESRGPNPAFEANPGGAPCNVLAMLSALGRKTAFIGKVGADYFGGMLHSALEELGISAEGLLHDRTYNTTLAFVHNDTAGERSFSFYRKPGADSMLRSQEVPFSLIEQSRIFHFGTRSMTDEPALEATRKALDCAKGCGALISFDPNLRPPLWESLAIAKDRMREGFSACDVLKIAGEELNFITGIGDQNRAALFLMDHYQIPLVFVTSGREGSAAYYPGGILRQETFLDVSTVDTTGAGDIFFGCMLDSILRLGPEGFSPQEMQEALRFASAAAAIVTTRPGAMRSVPRREEVDAFLNGHPL